MKSFVCSGASKVRVCFSLFIPLIVRKVSFRRSEQNADNMSQISAFYASSPKILLFPRHMMKLFPHMTRLCNHYSDFCHQESQIIKKMCGNVKEVLSTNSTNYLIFIAATRGVNITLLVPSQIISQIAAFEKTLNFFIQSI